MQVIKHPLLAKIQALEPATDTNSTISENLSRTAKIQRFKEDMLRQESENHKPSYPNAVMHR